MKRILCFGDSNTYGSNPHGGRHEDRWPVVLARELGDGYTVIEEGFGGRTVAMDDPVEGGYKSALDYIIPCLGSHCPLDMIIIMLGTNDAKARFNLNAPAIAMAMGTLIRRVRTYAYTAAGDVPEIVIVSPPAIREGIKSSPMGPYFGPASAEVTRGLAEEYARTARLMRCRFFDANGVCSSSETDKVHMEREDHISLGKALAAQARQMLENR